MNREQILKKTNDVAAALIYEKGYISPVDLFLKMEVITSKDYEDWRMGKIPYLEKVTSGGLGKLNTILTALKAYAASEGLKPSRTVYNKWGKGAKKKLRFSKRGLAHVELRYETHYVKQ